MKCEFCGGNLSLEEKYCPHCGQINKHSQKHIRDMGRFRKSFEATREKVYGITNTYTQLTVRIVLICILVVLTLVLLILGSNAYSAVRSLKKNSAERNWKSYSTVLDGYMEEGKFAEFYYFCEVKYIDGFDGPYSAYAPVISAARNYVYLMERITDMICMDSEEEWNFEPLGDAVYTFYNRLDVEKWDYYENADSEKNRLALQEAKKQAEYLLMTYCSLSKEDVEKLPGMNASRITVMIEEAMNNGA